jgi:hypothetical protein
MQAPLLKFPFFILYTYCMAIYAVDDATPGVHVCGWESESIEWIIEDQTFLAVVWFRSSPTPSPLSRP